MRPFVCLGLAVVAQLARGTPLIAQERAEAWRIEGLRSAFCIQLLVDPASDAMERLPAGYRPLAASGVKDLHMSLRGVVQSQVEFASWTPSRLCFFMTETVQAGAFTLRDRSGRKPHLIGAWLVAVSTPAGKQGEVALELFANSDRLVRSARLSGQILHEARLRIGKVPLETADGVPSSDDRFELHVGKTVLIWDGRLAGDSTVESQPIAFSWATSGARGGVANGVLTLAPSFSRAMAGALKVEGKAALAKALKASPTRFAGPNWWGGGGAVRFDK